MEDQPSKLTHPQDQPESDQETAESAASTPQEQELSGMEAERAGAAAAKPSSHTGQWILIVLIALVIGFAVSYFVLALPAQKQVDQKVEELADLQEKLDTAEADLAATREQLAQTNAELEDAQYALALARVQVNVAYARSSLISRDLLTARQEVSAAVKNMEVLLPLIQDRETADALKERMDSIDKAVLTDSSAALEELRILSENLLRLEDR